MNEFQRGRAAVARWPHKPQVVGSSPTPATKFPGIERPHAVGVGLTVPFMAVRNNPESRDQSYGRRAQQCSSGVSAEPPSQRVYCAATACCPAATSPEAAARGRCDKGRFRWRRPHHNDIPSTTKGSTHWARTHKPAPSQEGRRRPAAAGRPDTPGERNGKTQQTANSRRSM